MKTKKKQKIGIATPIAIGAYLFLITALVQFEQTDPNASIKTWFDGAWYSIVTLTTVGYGDFYPITTGGRIIGLILVLGSVGIFGYIIGKISNRATLYMEQKKLGLNGTKFSGHTIIIGWDEFGRLVSNQLLTVNSQIAIVTNNKNDVDLIRDVYPETDKVFILFADFHNLEALKTANIQEANSVFLNFKDDSETLVYLLNLRNAHPQQNIIVSINNNDLRNTFRTAGVDYMVSKNDLAAKLVASFIFEPEVAEFTEDIMEAAVHPTRDFDMQQFQVIEKNPFRDKDCMYTFMHMKQKYDAIFMGVVKFQRGKWELLKNPSEETIIRKGDYIIVVSNIEARDLIEKDFGVDEGKVFDEEVEF